MFKITPYLHYMYCLPFYWIVQILSVNFVLNIVPSKIPTTEQEQYCQWCVYNQQAFSKLAFQCGKKLHFQTVMTCLNSIFALYEQSRLFEVVCLLHCTSYQIKANIGCIRVKSDKLCVFIWTWLHEKLKALLLCVKNPTMQCARFYNC